MRAWMFLLLAIAACSPDIESGAYLCGPEAACPDGQVCNGTDNTCVAPVDLTPFACLPTEEHEPDNTPAQGFAITGLACVSTVFTQDGCLAAGDTADWFQFTTPAGCTAIEVDLRVTYPEAFEPIGLVLADGNGTTITTDTACTQASTTEGSDVRCLKQTISAGTPYTFEVKPAGGGDCAGACNYNRYSISMQLVTPG